MTCNDIKTSHVNYRIAMKSNQSMIRLLTTVPRWSSVAVLLCSYVSYFRRKVREPSIRLSVVP